MKRSTLFGSATAIGAAALVVAVAVRLFAGSFTESFTGAPAVAVPFISANWSFTVVSTNHVYGDALPAADTHAQHGPNCEAPGEDGSVTHTVSLFADLVYQCRDHVMTHLPDDQYTALEMTPNQMVDISGAATVKFDISTMPRSTRDWIDLWIQDPTTQEADPLDGAAPTQQGNPRNALHIGMVGAGPYPSPTSQDMGNRAFIAEEFDGNRNVVAYIEPPYNSGWMNVTTLSAQTRRTIQVDLTRTHVRVWMPEFNLVWVDADIPQLPFTQGIVSFGHHSYSPSKGADPVDGGAEASGTATSWHWDNVSINPAIPFEIIHSDHRAAQWNEGVAARTFTLEKPAPANSVLRFNGYGGNVGMKVSFNGAPVVDAVLSGAMRALESSANYLMPVPTGTTTIMFEHTSPGYGFVGAFANPTVFAFNGVGPTPTPTATPTATLTATPTPTPTAAPTPNGQVTVTFDDLGGQNQGLNGQYPTGLISWGTGKWYLSAPWSVHATKSVSFNTSSTSKTFAFVNPKILDSITAGGNGASTITLGCSGNPTKTQAIVANTLTTITTGWTKPCTTVTVGSSNGWDTNFDNLRLH